MAVLDVGLFTGYKPIASDLLRLREKGLVDSFEVSQRSVIFYIDEVNSFSRITFILYCIEMIIYCQESEITPSQLHF